MLVYAETTGSVQSKTDVPVTRRPRLSDDEFRAYGRKLTALAEHLEDRGVSMAYHHHMGTIVESQREIDLLMRNTGPAVGLLLDTGHLTYAGADVLGVTRAHGRRINHVHCKDVRLDVLKRVRQRNAELSGRGAARRVHRARATAASISSRSLGCWRNSATKAGPWSRRNRIPPRRRRSNIRAWAASISPLRSARRGTKS